ncbi:MAG: MnmC family methyltransferase [Cyanobium sp.]
MADRLPLSEQAGPHLRRTARLDPTATPPQPGQGLTMRTGRDGSFSLWSESFQEGFHSGRGAVREARETFLQPSELQRFSPGSTLRVLEVCVGTGCNLAVLLEACASRGLHLDWTGLELDPEPLRLALAQPHFRAPWQPQTLRILEQLQTAGAWSIKAGGEVATASQTAASNARATGSDADRSAQKRSEPVQSSSCGRMLWGDARQMLQQRRRQKSAAFDLIWHDAFSPQRCPQLWTLEFLGDLTRLLGPEGRWISYCSAAAVREALRLTGLQLVALPSARNSANPPQAWSGGTVASPSALPASPLWRALSPMELEHLASSAAEPYRDPTGAATAEAILSARQQAQAEALACGTRSSSSAWRRRWRLEG